MSTFIDALRRFADAVDILDEHALGEVLVDVIAYVGSRHESVVLFELLGASFGDAPKLFTIRNGGTKVQERWDRNLKTDSGVYDGQVSYAFDRKLKLCVVASDRKELDRAEAHYVDLWSKRAIHDIPRFKPLPYDDVGRVKTSLMLPLYVEKEGYVGLINIEFVDYIELSEEDRRDFDGLARAIALISLLHRNYLQQSRGTERALGELRVAVAERTQVQYRADLVAMATTPTEYNQLLRAFSLSRSDVERTASGHVVREWNGKKVVFARATEMGMPAAAATAMDLIHQYRPRYLAMTGIAAGVEGWVKLGDIIVADPSWDYGSGKIVSGAQPIDTRERRFELEPLHQRIDGNLRHLIEFELSERSLCDRLCLEAFPDKHESMHIEVHVGAVASGAAVIEAPDVVEWIRAQHRKLVGIDMETYGIMFAANNAPAPRPKAVSIKAVSDFAKPGRDRSFQPQAAYLSAIFLRELLVRLDWSAAT